MELCIRVMKRALMYEQTKDLLGKNFIVSPLSCTILLSMVASGLKGEALEQMMFFFRLRMGLRSIADLISESDRLMAMVSLDSTKGLLPLSSANGAWVDMKYKLKPSFQQVLKTTYRADSMALDFANELEEAVAEINTWVEKATNGNIKDSVSKQFLLKDTVLILANALYFKRTRKRSRSLLPSRTIILNFYTLDGKTVKVPFLTHSFLYFPYGYSQGCKILKLPYYVGNQKGVKLFSMYIFLPDEKDGLHDLIKQLSSDSTLLNLRFEFKYVKMEEIMIPKFKFKYSTEVSDIMEQMGLRLNMNKDAEMVEGVPDPSTAIIDDMKVCHSCCIEVDENRTDPVDLIDRVFGGGGHGNFPHSKFIADHPFMFMIREDTSETPIFVGAVVNPLLR
ncbi:serpin-Z10-like [Humulus lupulus]|uniref:serpin-Z10-like n=1 Tax=Humulus lupulus TaxID=3486 RepID=UPI002B401C54|nr:serpin-Z10-like [Humulus lupulus]